MFTNSINEKFVILQEKRGLLMKQFFLMCILSTLTFADLQTLSSFQADFMQTITDEKGKKLSYSGTLKAEKPNSALWVYEKPVKKFVYIQEHSFTIVEPEIEQVIVRNIRNDFDFFTLIQGAKRVDKEHYITRFEGSDIFITLQGKSVKSLSYKDKFDNDVEILFSNQLENHKLSPKIFKANYPLDYDVIQD